MITETQVLDVLADLGEPFGEGEIVVEGIIWTCMSDPLDCRASIHLIVQVDYEQQSVVVSAPRIERFSERVRATEPLRRFRIDFALRSSLCTDTDEDFDRINHEILKNLFEAFKQSVVAIRRQLLIQARADDSSNEDRTERLVETY